MLQAALMVGKTDIDKAMIVMLYSHAIACLGNIPIIEHLKVAKGPVLATIAVMAIIAELGRQGIIPADAMAYVTAAFYILPSLLEVFSPETTFESFGFALSPLGKLLGEHLPKLVGLGGLFSSKRKRTPMYS